MKVRKSWIGSKKPAALGNLATLQEDIHADLQKMATKEDVKDFVTKQYLDEHLGGMEDRVTNRVVTALKAYIEQIITKLKGLHDEEMAIVEGRKEAPMPWKSIPTRLAGVEQEVEKIKDHIQLP